MTSLASAREAESLSIEEIARRAEISVEYLKRIENGIANGGGCSISYPLALRLARLYRQSANVFLTKGQSGDRQRTQRKRKLNAS